MLDNKLGTIISKLRKEKGLTQKDLADKLNISDKAVSRWETGGSSPNMDMLLRISKFFKVPLNDLITARVSNEENGDEIVQEIIQEFSEMNKKNSARLKTLLISTVVIILILTITIIFTHTYNRFKVYRVHISSEEIYPATGVYIETKIKDSLNIQNIKIRNYEVKETDTISVDLYFTKEDKEYILQSYSSLDNIHFVTYQSYIEIDDLSDYFENLYLRITIIDSKGISKEYNGKLNFILDFSNNKIFYDEKTENVNYEINNLTVNEIKIILIENDFEETSGNVWWKENQDYIINYFADSNKFNINFEKNKLSYRYTYQLNNDLLTVRVFDENTTEIENYTYNTDTNEVIECKNGGCTDYEYAIKVLKENVLNLLHK